MTFGEKLEKLRKAKKMTQQDLADYLNVVRNTVYTWEADKMLPNSELLKEIAKLFEVTSDYLLGIETEDLEHIQRIRSALKDAGMLKNDDDLTEEELKFALKQVELMKEYNKINSENKGDN